MVASGKIRRRSVQDHAADAIPVMVTPLAMVKACWRGVVVEERRDGASDMHPLRAAARLVDQLVDLQPVQVGHQRVAHRAHRAEAGDREVGRTSLAVRAVGGTTDRRIELGRAIARGDDHRVVAAQAADAFERVVGERAKPLIHRRRIGRVVDALRLSGVAVRPARPA